MGEKLFSYHFAKLEFLDRYKIKSSQIAPGLCSSYFEIFRLDFEVSFLTTSGLSFILIQKGFKYKVANNSEFG